MNITNSIFQNKVLLITLAVLLVLVELYLFFIFAAKSGEKHTLQVLNDSGTVIYETDGAHLTKFKKYYFESTFGPFENYKKQLVTRTEPFPFRAWFTAAFAVPVGFTLLFAFVVSAFLTLTGKKQKAPEDPDTSNPDTSNPDAKDAPKGKVDQFIAQVSRMNIFILGAGIFLVVLAFWVLPNLVSVIGVTGLEIIDRYRWFFAVAGIAVFLTFGWFLYLRYLLAKKALEAETQIREHQLTLNQLSGPKAPILEIEDKTEPEITEPGTAEPEITEPDIVDIPGSKAQDKEQD